MSNIIVLSQVTADNKGEAESITYKHLVKNSKENVYRHISIPVMVSSSDFNNIKLLKDIGDGRSATKMLIDIKGKDILHESVYMMVKSSSDVLHSIECDWEDAYSHIIGNNLFEIRIPVYVDTGYFEYVNDILSGNSCNFIWDTSSLDEISKTNCIKYRFQNVMDMAVMFFVDGEISTREDFENIDFESGNLKNKYIVLASCHV